jgi:glucose/arabinose dehydrogenase
VLAETLTRSLPPDVASGDGTANRGGIIMRSGPAAALRSLLVATLLAACTGPEPAPSAGGPAASSTAGLPTGTPVTVASGLVAPWSVVFLGGAPLVAERDSARIVELTGDGSVREVGVVAGVRPGGEAGLLGMAVDDRDRLYVYSTARDGNRVERYDVTGDAGSLVLGDPTTVIDRMPSASHHDGGRLAFGPDGMLYVTVGDAGQRESAQDLGSLAGKILRLTPDGDVPADNPFPGSPVWSSGHRNPQGLAWDDGGTLYATEFGQDTWDELNVITPGANYGWPVVEGAAGRDGFTDPVQQWSPDDASPSGMVHLDGMLYIANLRGSRLRAVPVADLGASTDVYVGEYGRLRDVVVAPDGRLWFVTSNTDGRGDPGPDDDRVLSVAVSP